MEFTSLEFRKETGTDKLCLSNLALWGADQRQKFVARLFIVAETRQAWRWSPPSHTVFPRRASACRVARFDNQHLEERFLLA